MSHNDDDVLQLSKWGSLENAYFQKLFTVSWTWKHAE